MFCSLPDPGEKIDYQVTDYPGRFPGMPRTLQEALAALNSDGFLTGALGEELVKAFCMMKKREWEAYLAHISDWERNYYLNC